MADPFTSRAYADPPDLEAMLAFLRCTRPPQRLADYPGLADLRELAAQPEMLAHTRLWFNPAGHLAGFAWASEYNSIVIEPDPACGPDLEQAMLDWAIPTALRLAVERQETEAPTITCRADDLERIARLEQRGFQRLAEYTVHLARPLDQAIPEPVLPPGFIIRPFRSEAEIQEWVALHRAAFGTEFMTVEYRREMSGDPDYDPELDLLAVAPDGRLAAYVVGSYPKEENALTGRNIGYADPVATHPDFQGQGLAANLLLAVARRLKARGAAAVVYGTSSENLAMQSAGRKAGFAIESKELWFALPGKDYSVLRYARQNTDRFLAELIELCAIPSISSMPAHAADIQRAASMYAARLRHAGLQNVEILPTGGHPVVYGDWLQAGPHQPVVLFYGHYDVQPALDLSAWDSDPFAAQVRGDNLYGRGTSDMKGQIMAEIAAVESWLQAAGALPVNVKFLLEGEEEIGSKNLRQFIRLNPERLQCDVVFNPDAGMAGPDLPSITYSLRGGVRVDLTFRGPQQDVHSGTFGGTLLNPAQALIELIAGLHDAHGRVTLPGFYDRVRPLEPDERQELARLPMDAAFFLKQSGAPALWGEPEYTPYERTTARPTLEVLAFHAGLPGEGVLNIVPAKASAALSMRLVPDQEPEEIYQSLLRYLEQHVPPAVTWEARLISSGRPSLVDRNLPAAQALRRAYQQTWNVSPVFMRTGGGIAVVAQLHEELGLPSLLTGFSLNDDNAHGPNEKLHVPTWRQGIEAVIRFIAEMSQIPAGR